MGQWILIAVLLGLSVSLVDAKGLQDRLIPMPQEMRECGSVTLRAEEISVSCDAPDEPRIRTAKKILGAFAKGETGRFAIRMRLADGKSKLEKRLAGLPNADQAYAIAPEGDSGLLVVARTTQGLLYGARTLGQLISEVPVSRYAMIEIPLVEIVDWPDIAERGQWGWDVARHLRTTSAMKLNVIEENAAVKVDKDGSVSTGIPQKLFDEGDELGIDIVPFIVHFEQIYRLAKLENAPGVASTPDPSKPLPADYLPGLCMSSPATRALVTKWVGKIADNPKVTDIQVWLSEDRAPCF